MKYWKLLILVLTILIVFGCAPKKVEVEQGKTCYPQNLRVESNNEKLTVIWDMECDHLYSGYNIYISEEPLSMKNPNGIPSSIQPHNTSTYKGDTDPFDKVEHYEAERLENGKVYYVSATMVYTDMTNSQPSNEVKAVCGPHGEIELSVRYKSERDGFSLENNDYVRADHIDNDLYFFSKEGKDYINSPVKLDGFLKNNKFMALAQKGDLTKIKRSVQMSSAVPSEINVSVKKGDWVQMVTPDNKNALFQVIGFFGDGENRTVKLYFAYSTVANELIF